MASLILEVKTEPSGILGLIFGSMVGTLGLILVLALILITLYIGWRKKQITGEIELNKLAQTQIIVYAGFAIIFLLFISGVMVHQINGSEKFLINLSITIILSWFVLLICYYAWALYFYNINMGWSDDKWKRFRMKQEDPTTESQPRNENPHEDNTLGLPSGTIRGTIALTLLIGALALTIASFGMDSSTQSDMIMIDNFDFYKKAFLMMIAFYFGTKSLEILQSGSSTPPSSKPSSPAGTNTTSGYPQTTTTTGPPPGAAQGPLPNGLPPEAQKQVNLETYQKEFHHPDALG